MKKRVPTRPPSDIMEKIGELTVVFSEIESLISERLYEIADPYWSLYSDDVYEMLSVIHKLQVSQKIKVFNKSIEQALIKQIENLAKFRNVIVHGTYWESIDDQEISVINPRDGLHFVLDIKLLEEKIADADYILTELKRIWGYLERTIVITR